MRTRILPPEEWAQLERTNVPTFPGVRPEDSAIVVVEDGDKVIACMTVLRATHFEGTWIDPEHRNAGVTRGLLRLATAVGKSWGTEWVFTGAANEDDHTKSLIGRLGGVLLPMSTYVLPLQWR
jgi:hypothetical protein